MKKFLFAAIIGAIALFGFVVPAMENIGSGFSKDMDRAMSLDYNTSVGIQYDPDHPVISVFPNTTKAAVDEAGRAAILVTTILFIALAGLAVAGFIYLRVWKV